MKPSPFSKGVFPCQTKRGCPKAILPQGNVDYCPAWIDRTPEGDVVIETLPSTGEERVIVGCYFQVQLRMTRHVILAANRPTEYIHAMRTEMVQEVRETLIKTLPGVVQDALHEMIQVTEAQPALGHTPETLVD